MSVSIALDSSRLSIVSVGVTETGTDEGNDGGRKVIRKQRMVDGIRRRVTRKENFGHY